LRSGSPGLVCGEGQVNVEAILGNLLRMLLH
jgi:hypothetical protein